ncbi:PadR family transcriptional regulator [Clostridium ihumii]|uniref:PadR family transcriptional regulator n=1 Tax=Clostridium ihumii TaxID=1470356 RepID=UPI003D33743F
MSVQFKKGVLEMCVLTLLSQKDLYSYELSKSLDKYIQTADGTLYPLLRRLTADGYLTTYLVESSEGPARKYFRVTEEGKKKGKALREEWIDFCSKIDLFLEETKG